MYSDEELVSAVQAGVLTEENASAFRSHVTHLRKSPAVDEEYFRLITGFNDIFVVIACVLLLVAVGLIGNTVSSSLGAIVQATVAWGLAEFFTRKRRMALPSIVLLLTFVGGVFWATFLFLPEATLTYGIAGAVAALAAWLHWLRFKVPITVATGTAALVGCSIAILIAAIPETKQWTNELLFLAGIVVFVIAMRWDMSDTLRQTRRSDAAFWLHLLAAPLLVHPVFSSLGVFSGTLATWQASAVFALYVIVALVSISIDRRALMVSALGYVLYAFSQLLEHYGAVSLGFALTAFAIGSALLILSAFWHTSRAGVLRLYPSSIQRRLAPLR